MTSTELSAEAVEDAMAEYEASIPDPVRDALEAFVRQWNACGPNSNFGRYFQHVRDQAVKALAEQVSA